MFACKEEAVNDGLGERTAALPEDSELSAAKHEVTFEDLTVPPEALPDACELTPGIGLPFGPSEQPNPKITTDPMEVGMLSLFFMLENTQPPPFPDGGSEAEIQSYVSEQAAGIEEAYLAGYAGESNQETIVWALRFKNREEAKNRFERITNVHSSDRHYFIKDSILICAWTDGATHLLDAIRIYLENE
jgi:hypothetical protein